MTNRSEIRNFGFVLIFSGLLLTMPSFGQDNTIEVQFDEPLQDSGNVYYLDKVIEPSINREHSGKEVMSFGDKTFYYGMTEEAVKELLEAKDEDVVVVFTIGGNTGEESVNKDNKERNISGVSYIYEDNKLVEMEITQPLITSIGDFKNVTYDVVEKMLGRKTYMNTYDDLLKKGLVVYKNKTAFTYLYLENNLVKYWGVSNKDYRYKENWPLKIQYQSQAINYENGNSNANIINGGLITAQDGWYYYSQPTNEGEQLYKMSSDGLFRQSLTKDIPRYINVKGDWIYYVNLSDQTLNGEGKIYKVKTDGTERQVLTTIGAQYLVIDDEAVFFCSQGNSDNLASGLYAISNEGKDLRILDEGNASYLNIDGDGLYYLMDKDTEEGKDESKGSSPQKTIKVIYKGNQSPALYRSGAIGFLLVEPFRMYYSNIEDGHKVYINSSDMERGYLLSETPIISMNTYAEMFLFQSVFNELILSQDLLDKDAIKESTHRYNNIQMIGDKIFYQEEGNDGLVFRQKHLWKNYSKTISPTLIEEVFNFEGNSTTESSCAKSNNAEGGSSESNKNIITTIDNGLIIGRWGNDVFYYSTKKGIDGLFYMNGTTQMVKQLNGLAIEEAVLFGNSLYYIDKKTHYLMRSDFNGENRKILVDDLSIDLSTDGEWLYYQNQQSNWKIRLDGSDNQEIISTIIK